MDHIVESSRSKPGNREKRMADYTIIFRPSKKQHVSKQHSQDEIDIAEALVTWDGHELTRSLCYDFTLIQLHECWRKYILPA